MAGLTLTKALSEALDIAVETKNPGPLIYEKAQRLDDIIDAVLQHVQATGIGDEEIEIEEDEDD